MRSVVSFLLALMLGNLGLTSLVSFGFLLNTLFLFGKLLLSGSFDQVTVQAFQLSLSKLTLQTAVPAGFAFAIWRYLSGELRDAVARILFIGTPYLWLLALFIVPFGIVLKISLSDLAVAIPPYTPTYSITDGWAGFKAFLAELDFENYIWLTEDALYWKAYLSSLKIAVISTLLTLLVGYPIAYGMARAPEEWRAMLFMLVILPFWTSFLIRVYSWMGILSQEGYLNQVLLWIGVINEPLIILNTNIAVYIGIVYTYLPFMILPIYAALEKLDISLLEAAEDLGCSRFSAFWLVTIPLSKQGIIAGSFLVFIPTIGEFVIPSLLGGSRTLMIGKVLWEEFFSNRDWPVASAVAVVLLLILIIPIVLFQRNEQKQREADQ